ncbi:hypothetical protein [Niabella terrae]
MDTRETLDKGASFLLMLRNCRDQQLPAAILYDDQGITRASGKIIEIQETTNPPVIRLESGLEISVGSLIAVNGIFLDNYTEC